LDWNDGDLIADWAAIVRVRIPNKEERMRVMMLALALSLVSCTDKPDARPPMTQRQRDSAIGASRLPGAQGVRGALRAADSAQARANLADSIN
jgi:hypothetical protein